MNLQSLISKKYVFLYGIKIMMLMLVIGMTLTSCGKDDDDPNNEKVVASVLIGKWEIKKIIIDGEEHNLPYTGINSGGYEFTKNSVKIFLNGTMLEEAPAYSEGNKIYSDDEVDTWVLTGNTLTLTDADGSVTICEKVSEFSWENDSGKSVNSALIAKWEVKKVIIEGVELELPFPGLTSAGYEFTKNSLKFFLNGTIDYESPAYTEGNKIFDDEDGYTIWLLTGNTLTFTYTDGDVMISEKVSKFSWE